MAAHLDLNVLCFEALHLLVRNFIFLHELSLQQIHSVLAGLQFALFVGILLLVLQKPLLQVQQLLFNLHSRACLRAPSNKLQSTNLLT